ncbi:MAG: divalent cation transporter [Waddliaceae bacterium]|nr:divalent cation transporter [Waddliaceae bacterium]
MSEWLSISVLTLLAGLAMVFGALIASVEHISNRWLENEFRHTVIAFGGGILVSAISLVLVEEGMRNLTLFPAVFCFGAGGCAFMYIDMILSTNHGSAAQLTAMLTDFIPESIALGALYLLDKPHAILLACLIALQNIPEGFNAYLELKENSKRTGPSIIRLFFLMAFIGPITGLSGYYFFSSHPAFISGLMLFASGGILYLVFQDIAPQSKIRNHKGPALGAVGGFLLGMIGKMLVMNM